MCWPKPKYGFSLSLLLKTFTIANFIFWPCALNKLYTHLFTLNTHLNLFFLIKSVLMRNQGPEEESQNLLQAASQLCKKISSKSIKVFQRQRMSNPGKETSIKSRPCNFMSTISACNFNPCN